MDQRRIRRSEMRPAAIAVALLASGCSQQVLLGSAYESAYRPALLAKSQGKHPQLFGYQVLAGDFHTHVGPPDHPSHVSRDLATTVKLARAEGIDFLVLTPHVHARFYLDPELRAQVVRDQRALRDAITLHTDITLIPGFEYTDHVYGHVGMSFADLDTVLAETDPSRPESFVERWVARDGLLVVNHPLVGPLSSPVSFTKNDLSWRPFTHPELEPPPDIATIDRVAQGFEAYNVVASHLRDRLVLGDPLASTRETFARLDREIEKRRRRMTPLGGSDSHTDSLRATTFVLADANTPKAIHDAVVAGRVCVRSPAACTLEARVPGGQWQHVGASLPEGPIEVRARGGAIDILVDGKNIAHPASGVTTTVHPPKGSCSTLRARVDDGFSGPIYAGCGV